MSLTLFTEVFVRHAPMSLDKALELLSMAAYSRTFTMNEDFFSALKFASDLLSVLRRFKAQDEKEWRLTPQP